LADPLILVTNDDGIHAPGIRALAQVLGGLGEVWTVAPDREASASGQSLTLKHPVRAERIEPNGVAVDGTPADCVNLAVVKLLPRRPALVVSGINRGGNLGEDVFCSGTSARPGRPRSSACPRSRCRWRRAPSSTTRRPRSSPGGSRRSSSSAACLTGRC
jgi:survival protein SurE